MRCVAWGCGSSFGEKPFFRKRTVFPRPPLSKETYSNLYLFFSRFTAQTIFICFQHKVASTFSRQTPIQSLFILNFKLLPLFSSSTAQSYFICLNFKLLPLFSRFDTRLLSAFPLSAQLIYTGSENTWLVYMRMLKSMSCFCINEMRQRPTLPYSVPYSTIGSMWLNFRVRNENGWIPHDIITAMVCYPLLGSRSVTHNILSSLTTT